MHRTDNSKFVLYIEPKKEQKSEQPINDEITEFMQMALDKSVDGIANYSSTDAEEKFTPNMSYKGFHVTECGKRSSSVDYLLPNGMITNSLCVFYLQHYRNAIPQSEWNKINELIAYCSK